jgi:exosortase D (VPLPA-CTERM-specific)
LFRASFWKRAIVFLSTIPITLLMNSARIGMIGVLSEHFGKSMAEGFLHDFEGWAVFMVCTALLIAEIALLARIGPVKATLADVFSVPTMVSNPATTRRNRFLPWPFIVAGIFVIVAAAISQTVSIPSATLPGRHDFAEFPMDIDGWHGTPRTLEREYLQMLKLDDYLLADYAGESRGPVNMYVSYYAAQANGNSAHSPRACIPGDGWEISDFSQRQLEQIVVGRESLKINRVVIQRGDNRQLVYYWFQQHGRAITNEYMVKLQIFWDAVTRHRTDGAMVRLVAGLLPGEPVEAGDERLERFAAHVVPSLNGFVPD